MLQRVTGGLEQVRPLVTGDESLEDHWLPGLLALYTELEMLEPAARLLTHLRDRLDDYRAGAQWAGVLAFATEAAAKLDDTVAAAVLRPLLAEYAGTNLMAGANAAVFGSADRYLAQLDSVLGAPSADQHFERALEMDRRMGAVTHQVETLAAWSWHRARRERPGDDGQPSPSATRLAEEARALARHIGHRRVLRDLDADPAPHPERARSAERPDRAGGRRAPPGRGRAVQPGDRRTAVHQRQHLGQPRAQHPHQDRRAQPHQGSGLRHRARSALATDREVYIGANEPSGDSVPDSSMIASAGMPARMAAVRIASTSSAS